MINYFAAMAIALPLIACDTLDKTAYTDTTKVEPKTQVTEVTPIAPTVTETTKTLDGTKTTLAMKDCPSLDSVKRVAAQETILGLERPAAIKALALHYNINETDAAACIQ